MPPPIPLSTYRLQLSKNFGFDDAARIVPYLKSLGVTHLYASPFLKARAGSRHGYDVVDFQTLNPEFGGDEAFSRLSAALRDSDLGLILDFVPNHMAVGYADNAWWLDVLEWGPKSPRAASFDINWDLLPYRRGGGVLLPVLGCPYGDALTRGEIALRYDAGQGSFSAWYFEHRFPINPQRYSDIIKTVVTAANATETAAGQALIGLADEYSRPGTPAYSQAATLKTRLSNIDGAVEIIERGLAAYRPDHDGGVNLLHRLLERQHYRLADWHLAVSGINYRRFFDINELAGLRVEDTKTFHDMHERVARLIAEDRLQGLRLDHIDGLLDPAQYTRRLHQLIRQVRGPQRRPIYITVEKILADGESLPVLPGVAGTTGYEWLNTISRFLVHEPGRLQLDTVWRGIDPAHGNFDTVLDDAKLRVLDSIMASEFSVLVQLLSRIAAGHFTTRDYAQDRLREALKLYAIAFPIYRTYITASAPRESDRTVIDSTIAAARRRWVGTDADIFNFLRDALTLDLIRSDLPYSQPRVRQFALKMQQFTGPMMAKSLEDTAFYRYHNLIALNEVGGHPTLPALSVADFHDRMTQRLKQWPHGLTATATHDTKRGEDARARILALSEIPELWAEHLRTWQRLNARCIESAGGNRAPSAAHEYLIYQTLVGAWPNRAIDDSFVQRIEDYAVKAAREGKLETDWLNPNEDYEQGLRRFVRAILDRQQSGDFIDSFAGFAKRTALLGALNGLSQLVLKATMPGVPDFYQGTERWDLSLVDPDNRRPVDFAERATTLAALRDADLSALSKQWPDGRIKFALTHRLMMLRTHTPEPFLRGGYQPVDVTGPDRDHVLAFLRSARRQQVLVVVPRHFSGVTGNGAHWPRIDWQAQIDLDRPLRLRLINELGDNPFPETGAVADVLAQMPVAIYRTA